MAKFSGLPTEVLTSVVSLLPREDLVVLTKTSRLLRLLALQNLFRFYSICGLKEGEYYGSIAPSDRTAHFKKTLGLLKSVTGASEHVRELKIGLPPVGVENPDSWIIREKEQNRKADEPILSDEMLQDLLELLPGLRGLRICQVQFETTLDFMITSRIISVLSQGSSGKLQKLAISGWPRHGVKDFNAAVDGGGISVPEGLEDLKIDLNFEASGSVGYPEGLPAYEKALTCMTSSLLNPSKKTLTRLSLEVGVDLNGTADCYSHMEVDLDKLAEAPLKYLALTARRKEDESDNIPKICKNWPVLENLELTEYWPARRAVHGGKLWCGGMELIKWRKQWVESMKSLQKLKSLYLSYDLERDAGDLQENIFDQYDDDSESEEEADDKYTNWEKGNIKRRLKVSRNIAGNIPVLGNIEWRNVLEDGNTSDYRFEVLRNEDGEVSDIRIHNNWWDRETEDEEDEENGDRGSNDEWTDEDEISQSAFEGTLDFGPANGSHDAEDAEGEAAY